MTENGIQQSLGAFTESGWELVEEWAEDGDRVALCPDCGDGLNNNYWPTEQEGVDAVHGAGCDHCQIVVPHPPPAHPNLPVCNDVVDAELRSGETVEVGVAGGASDD